MATSRGYSTLFLTFWIRNGVADYHTVHYWVIPWKGWVERMNRSKFIRHQTEENGLKWGETTWTCPIRNVPFHFPLRNVLKPRSQMSRAVNLMGPRFPPTLPHPRPYISPVSLLSTAPSLQADIALRQSVCDNIIAWHGAKVWLPDSPVSCLSLPGPGPGLLCPWPGSLITGHWEEKGGWQMC